MPSFVYIARITRLSEAQAQGLRSAGFHVKTFGPGEITADECLLVMTSEALLASLHPANSGSTAGRAAATGGEFEGIPPIPDMNAHLGSQAAVWNIIKMAAANESARSGSAVYKLSSSSQEKSGIEQSPTSATVPGNVSGWPSRLWRLMATIVTLLIVAAALLTHRVSILGSATDNTAADTTNQSTATGSDTTKSAHAASGKPSQPINRPHNSLLTLSSADASTVSAGVRRHPSEYDFVAEDFTNHFEAHAPSRATLQNPELRHNAQSSLKENLKEKRVVVN